MQLKKEKGEYTRDGKEISKASYYRLLRKSKTVLRQNETKSRSQHKRTPSKMTYEDWLFRYKAKNLTKDLIVEYVIEHRLETYRISQKNKTNMLTQKCLKYVEYDKDLVRVVKNNMKK